MRLPLVVESGGNRIDLGENRGFCYQIAVELAFNQTILGPAAY